MADEPSKAPGIPAEHPSPQMIPLSKIHDLPGMFIQKQPDKNYGGLVSSIQASGVKEPVILRLREDGEYQLIQYDGWAVEAVQTAVALGWIEDSADFAPNAIISRGEFMQLVNGVLTLYRAV